MRDSTRGKAWHDLQHSLRGKQTQAPEKKCCLLVNAFSCKRSTLGRSREACYILIAGVQGSLPSKGRAHLK